MVVSSRIEKVYQDLPSGPIIFAVYSIQLDAKTQLEPYPNFNYESYSYYS